MKTLFLLLTLVLSSSAFAEVVHREFDVNEDDCTNRAISTYRFGICRVKLVPTSAFEVYINGTSRRLRVGSSFDKHYDLRLNAKKDGYELRCQKFLNDRIGYVECSRFDLDEAMEKMLRKYPELARIEVWVNKLQ